MLDQIGGTESMVAGAGLSGLALGLLALLLQFRLGWVTALAWCGLLWWLGVIGLVTLIPIDGIILDRGATAGQVACWRDIGGQTSQGFWIFDGDQRTLNTVLFLPAGALLVLAVARWRAGWLLAPIGLAALAAYSVGIEYTQLELARIGRACDFTDIVDNVTGAILGFGAGLLLTLVLRPWRHKHLRRERLRTR